MLELWNLDILIFARWFTISEMGVRVYLTERAECLNSLRGCFCPKSLLFTCVFCLLLWFFVLESYNKKASSIHTWFSSL